MPMLGGARVALPEAAPPPARRQGEELANRPGRRGAPGKGGTGRPLTREDTVASSNGRRPTRAQGGEREGGGAGASREHKHKHGDTDWQVFDQQQLIIILYYS